MSIFSSPKKDPNEHAERELVRRLFDENNNLKKNENKGKLIENEISRIKHEQARLQAELVVKEREFKKTAEEDARFKQNVTKLTRDINIAKNRR